MSRKKHKKKAKVKKQQMQEAEKKSQPIKETQQKPAKINVDDEKQARISVLIFTVAAVSFGYISIILSQIIGNMATIFVGLVFSWVITKIVQIILGKKDVKWLIGNGLFIYLFVWLISWIFFFNLF